MTALLSDIGDSARIEESGTSTEMRAALPFSLPSVSVIKRCSGSNSVISEARYSRCIADLQYLPPVGTSHQ